MRSFYLIPALAILLLSGAGILFWSDYAEIREVEKSPAEAVLRLKQHFESSQQALFKINTEEVRQSRDASELIDPAAGLPQTQNYLFGDVAGLQKFAATCGKIPKLIRESPVLRKTLIWHEFICGKRPELPQDFFETRPFIHLSGESFVARAVESKRLPFSTQEWLQGHLRWSHILENLCKSGTDCKDAPLSKLLPAFSPQNLKDLLTGENLIETQEFVLIAHRSSQLANSTVTYSVYPRTDWENFLRHQLLRAKLGGSRCFFQDGSECWVKNVSKDQRESLRLAALVTSGLFALIIFLVIQAVRRSRHQQRISKERAFVFQMLTHEIRTPATSLQLSLETLRAEFDQLPKASQEAFLQICDQTQRLNRIIEASKQYLTTDKNTHRPALNGQAESIHDLFDAILEPYSGRVIFSKLPADREIILDRYWVDLCVRNLVENALAHGKPPVTVSLTEDSMSLIIQVKDQGTLPAQTLDELAVPFQKAPGSRGLGLGLVLVKKVSEMMGAELSVTHNPTTFSLIIRNPA